MYTNSLLQVCSRCSQKTDILLNIISNKYVLVLTQKIYTKGNPKRISLSLLSFIVKNFN